RAEHGGVMALDPGRGVDQQRETRRMAFREAIFAEPLDLPETALGEIARIATPRHPVDELVAEELDRAGAAEGRHRPAELVRLARLEAGRDDGGLHRLFLEPRHAKGPA